MNHKTIETAKNKPIGIDKKANKRHLHANSSERPQGTNKNNDSNTYFRSDGK